MRRVLSIREVKTKREAALVSEMRNRQNNPE